MKYDLEIINKAKSLFEEGYKTSEISKILNIPRSSVIYLSKRNIKNNNDHFNFLKKFNKEYSYILGLYLGDGYINFTGKTYRLRITLDIKYPELIDYATNMLKTLFPDNSISNNKSNITYIILSVYNKELIEFAFPQNGFGKKYLRDVSLKEWQYDIIDYKFLLMGLFHSDGCYYFNKKQKKYYYQFKNKSLDLINLFSECCYNFNIKYFINFNKKNEIYTLTVSNNYVETLHNLIGDKLKMG